jgi:hypothetical protein
VVIKTGHRMLLRREKRVAVYYEKHRERTNAQCGKDTVFMNVKAYGYT